MLVTFTHVFATVIVRATEHHGQKALLFRGLSFHIHIVEEPVDPIITQDLAIKDVHRCIDSRLSTQTFV
jgi:hypothetical protein